MRRSEYQSPPPMTLSFASVTVPSEFTFDRMPENASPLTALNSNSKRGSAAQVIRTNMRADACNGSISRKELESVYQPRIVAAESVDCWEWHCRAIYQS